MRTFLVIVAAFLSALLLSAAANANAVWPGNDEVSFTRNDGQWDEQVRFRATSGSATIWFTDGGVKYSLVRSTGSDFQLERGPRENLLAPPDEKIESLGFGVRFLGSNPRPEVVGLSEKDYCFNYFIGNNPTKWKTSVPSFDTVLYREIYPGIDMKYYGSTDGVEYSFVLSPGADPSIIKLQYEGIESLSLGASGELVIGSAWGNMTEQPPIICQMAGDREVEIAGSFEISEGNSFGFVLEDYDAESELIIDPVLTFSTYFGGSGTQYCRGIALDQAGNIVVTGHTYSPDFPTTLGAIQPDFAGGMYDIFIAKLNPYTSELLYGTFFGGSEVERSPCIALDGLDNIYVTGQTESEDLPVRNAYQESFKGGGDENEIFVLKLNAEGNSIQYCTYLGGGKDERATGLAIDALGSAYLCGVTDSDDFDIQNAFQPVFAGGPMDGFVTKFSPSGSSLVYSTYLGGVSTSSNKIDADYPRSIAVNQAGEAYVVGSTPSPDFPIQDPLYPCQIHEFGPIDAFITKFSVAGNTLEFSTFFGGTDDEWIQDIVLDDNSNVYLFGCVESYDFPVLNPIQAEKYEDSANAFLGGADLFVSILTGEGDALLYSTYLGGDNEDFAEGIDLGPDGSIYITGATYSTDFPVVNYLDGTLGGEEDAVVARIAPDGSALVYSTYLGGSLYDWAFGLAAGTDGSVAICGDTKSTDFPLVNPYQSTPPFNQTDAFITQISGGCCAGIRGNFDGDAENILDIYDIYAAVSWTFEGGPAPLCLEEADADGDGIVTIEDLVRLVNYIYDGGPAPSNCE